MSKEKLIEKIKKLLVRTEANGCTPAEAATASAQVAILLAKNNLTLEDINTEEMELVRESFVKDTKSSNIYQAHIAKELAEHFGVSVFMSTKASSGRCYSTLQVYGEKIKVDAFKLTYEFVYKAYQRLWTSYHKTLAISTSEKNAMRLSYLKGFVDGVTNEIIREENANAIVPVKSDSVQEFEKTLCGVHRFSNAQLHNANAEVHGYKDGSYAQRQKTHILS